MNNLISKYIEKIASLQPKPKEDRYFKTQSLDDAYEYGWRDCLSCIKKMQSALPIDIEQTFRTGKIDGVKECTVKHKVIERGNENDC